MILAADYPLLELVWTMFVLFGFVVWFWLLISVFGDVFSRTDLGGFSKLCWAVFVIIVPLLGVLVYMAARGSELSRLTAKAEAEQTTGPAAEISSARVALDAGTISQADFDAIRAKALA